MYKTQLNILVCAQQKKTRSIKKKLLHIKCSIRMHVVSLPLHNSVMNNLYFFVCISLSFLCIKRNEIVVNERLKESNNKKKYSRVGGYNLTTKQNKLIIFTISLTMNKYIKIEDVERKNLL